MPLDTLATAVAVAEQVPVHADLAATALPQARYVFSAETAPLPSATASAVAEPVQARAETVSATHSAAIIPFPAPGKAERLPLTSSALLIPPSGCVPDIVRWAVGGVIRAATHIKNVPLPPDEAVAVTTAVLDAITSP